MTTQALKTSAIRTEWALMGFFLSHVYKISWFIVCAWAYLAGLVGGLW